MDTERLTKELKDYVFEQDADLVGVAPVERFAEAPRGHSPRDLLPEATSVVVLAFRLVDRLVEGLPGCRPMYTENFHYVNTEMAICTTGTVRFLIRRGFATIPVYYSSREMRIPSPGRFFDEFSLRHAAQAAGLGRIGTNQLLVTPQFGPRVRLSAVITSAPLVPDPVLVREVCEPERCNWRCVLHCPAGALKRHASIDKEACNKYMFETLDHLRCGMCVASCPVTLKPLRRAADSLSRNWRAPRKREERRPTPAVGS
jgi:epoxyqueuosine reductase QueG